MGIGGGIFLIVVGAILAFAVSADPNGINLPMVGYILMAGGLVALIASLVVTAQRSNTSHREVVERYDGHTDAPPPAH